jgi:hypothetical protein
VTYRWARMGDVNAFFGLMLDNVANLVILSGVLVFVFGYPEDIVYTRMFPGTALGVMFGDLVYTWLAFRLAAKTGRDDVTAMPLGLDSPSTIGMAFAVLGPAFVTAKQAGLDDAAAGLVGWKVGMATMVLIGVFKLVMAFVGRPIQRAHPRRRPARHARRHRHRAARLRSSSGSCCTSRSWASRRSACCWYSLVGRIKLPFGAPEVLTSAARGHRDLYYGLHAVRASPTPTSTLRPHLPRGLPAAHPRASCRACPRRSARTCRSRCRSRSSPWSAAST